MSQSPTTNQSVAGQQDSAISQYEQGWSQLDELLRHGGSLSGREANCCYLNLGSEGIQGFADLSHVGGFDATVDGRGLALADWDHDGDLDIWMSNRSSPSVQFLRNNSHSGQHFVALRLQGTKSNRDAIGARVEIEVAPSVGVISRTVTAGDAYLSQSSKWLHFGLGKAQRITSVRVRWPGSRKLESIAGIELDGQFHMVEGMTSAARQALPNKQLTSPYMARETTVTNDKPPKMFVTGRLPLPPLDIAFEDQGMRGVPLGEPTLVLFWSPQCPRCHEELARWSRQSDQTQSAGLRVMAISPAEDENAAELARDVVQRTGFPFAWGLAGTEQLNLIEAYLGFL